jgi:hypothetical protein
MQRGRVLATTHLPGVSFEIGGIFMKILLRIGLCCLLSGGLMAQRGGGGHGGGGMGGGVRGGGIGGVRGGYGGYGYGGYGYGGYGYGRGFYGGYGRGLYGGFGYGYGLGLYGYGLGYGGYPYYYDYSPYTNPSYSYPSYEYNPSPNVTVIYPAQQAQPVYSAPPQTVMRSYDQYGQAVQPAASSQDSPSGSPIYLIATKDQTIHAAAAYWVDGGALHYVTLQHEVKQVPLDSVDRDLSQQLNRERRVAFRLPQ